MADAPSGIGGQSGGPLLLTVRCATPLIALALTGCSHEPPETTTVVIDGRIESIVGDVTCITQPDGNLLILANGKNHHRMRVLIEREHQLVVKTASFRIGDVGGYTDNSAEMWASKVDDTYRISGRMPPNDGGTGTHQFVIETRCRSEVPQRAQNPGIADYGP